MSVRNFKLFELGKSYTHKKDRMEMFTFLQLATPSQMIKKSNMQVSAWDQSPHKILNKYKEFGIHVRTKSEWL
jgi:hypothetical protein